MLSLGGPTFILKKRIQRGECCAKEHKAVFLWHARSILSIYLHNEDLIYNRVNSINFHCKSWSFDKNVITVLFYKMYVLYGHKKTPFRGGNIKKKNY